MPDYSSKLEPYRDFIAAERRKKTTYRKLAELLAQKGVMVDYSTIHSFVRVRAKPPRKVITMWEEPAQIATPSQKNSPNVPREARTISTTNSQSDRSGQLEAILRLKQSKPSKRGHEKGLPSFQEDMPLEHLSEEEARLLREQL